MGTKGIHREKAGGSQGRIRIWDYSALYLYDKSRAEASNKQCK